MRAAIWLRVSTDDKGQDPELQRQPVELLCQARGWEVVKVYRVEESAFVTEDRRIFYTMIADAKNGEFDVIAAWSMDRFSREGPLAMMRILIDLIDAKVGFASVSEPFLDTTGGNPFAIAMAPFFAWVANQSSVTKSKAIRLGMGRIQRGEKQTKSGKPIGRTRTVDESLILEQYRLTTSPREIARQTGYKPGTVWNVLAKHNKVLGRPKPLVEK